jgi:hypothetical protein
VPDVLLGSLQLGDVAGHLFLAGRELLHGLPDRVTLNASLNRAPPADATNIPPQHTAPSKRNTNTAFAFAANVRISGGGKGMW